jgi:hypothetical protein
MEIIFEDAIISAHHSMWRPMRQQAPPHTIEPPAAKLATRVASRPQEILP